MLNFARKDSATFKKESSLSKDTVPKQSTPAIKNAPPSSLDLDRTVGQARASPELDKVLNKDSSL